MKIIHWAIIFALIVLPFSLICRSTINNRFLALKDEVRINNAIDTATQDAVDLIAETAELGYGKNINITEGLATEAIKQFFTTMAVNFNLPYNNNAIVDLQSYIPAVLIIGYDGFYIYSAEEINGEIIYTLKPKIPYSYEENGVIINFTLDNYVTMYYSGNHYSDVKTRVFSGYLYSEYVNEYKEITDSGDLTQNIETLPYVTDNLSLILKCMVDERSTSYDENIPSFLTTGNEGTNMVPLEDYKFDEKGNMIPYIDAEGKEYYASEFHKKRRETIVGLITAALEDEINEHNSYAAALGVEYKFVLPEISKEEWINTVDDVSVLSFIQGLPIGVDEKYNNYALGGSRIVYTDYIYCVKVTENSNTKSYYHRENCEDVIEAQKEIDENKYELSDIFFNKAQAAKAGYHWCTKCKP